MCMNREDAVIFIIGNIYVCNFVITTGVSDRNYYYLYI